MRHVVLVLCILSAIPMGGCGAIFAVKTPAAYEANLKLRDEFNSGKQNPGGQVEVELNNTMLYFQYQAMRVFPFMIGSTCLALFAGIVVEFRRGFSAAVLLLAAIIGPCVAVGTSSDSFKAATGPFTISTLTYMLVSPLALPMLLALFVRKPTAAELERAAERKARQKDRGSRRSRDDDRDDDRRSRRSRNEDDRDDDRRSRDDNDDDDRRDDRGRAEEDDFDDRPQRSSRRPSR